MPHGGVLLLELAAGFLGGVFGGVLAYFLASFVPSPLKNLEKPSTLMGMAVPGRHRGQKRTPKALTDLMAYQKEIQEEGENRG